MRRTRLRLRACYNISQPIYVRSVKHFAPFQGLGESVCLPIYFEDFDRLVGRTCCKTTAVVVEDSIVLESPVLAIRESQVRKLCAYDHVLVA